MNTEPTNEPGDPAPAEPTPQEPSLGAGGAGDDPAHTPAPTWPDDWRERLAGEDGDALKTLKRWKSPDNIWKAYQGIRSKMDAGELRSAMPDPSNEEAIKVWREENGIPETADGYKEGLEFEIDESDEPFINRLLENMHASGATPEQARKGLETYFQFHEELAEQRHEKDKEFRAEAEDILRAEWGPEFRANLNGMRNMINMYGSQELQEAMFTSRQADGTLLGDNPDLLKFLVNLNGELNPHGTVTPSAGETPVQTIDREMKEIEAMMRDRNSDYWHDDKMQARYRQLIDMKDRHAA